MARDTMSTCLPPMPQFSAPPPEPLRNRAQRRVDKRTTLAALKAVRAGGAVDTTTPTTDAVRATVNQTLAGAAVALKQGLPGVDFLVIGLRHGGAGKSDVFLKSTLPSGADLMAAEVLEGLAQHFRARSQPAAPPAQPEPTVAE